MRKANGDILQAAAMKGVSFKQIADLIGVKEVEFICMMHKELSNEAKAGTLAAIENIPKANPEHESAKSEVKDALANARKALVKLDDIREAAFVGDCEELQRLIPVTESYIKKAIQVLAKLDDGRIAFGEYLEIPQKICPMSLASGRKNPCRKDCAWFVEPSGCFAEHAARVMKNATP